MTAPRRRKKADRADHALHRDASCGKAGTNQPLTHKRDLAPTNAESDFFGGISENSAATVERGARISRQHDQLASRKQTLHSVTAAKIILFGLFFFLHKNESLP